MSDISQYTYIYLYIPEQGEWEDQVIYLHLEQAINASRKDPYGRVEIFVTNCSYAGYKPTYEYYKGGILYQKS